MLRDITIGQHFPGTSLVHRFDPRMKLVLTIVYIVLLFAASNPLGLTLSILFLALMYKVAQIPFKMILKSLKPILPIVVFTAVLNLFFVSGEGDPLVKLGFLTIYAEGVRYAVLMAVRVMALIAGTSLLTYTTSPIVLTDAIEQLLKPLGRLHFPVHELAMMMSIALRFIPTLIEETDKIMNAQKARGARTLSGGLWQCEPCNPASDANGGTTRICTYPSYSRAETRAGLAGESGVQGKDCPLAGGGPGKRTVHHGCQ